MVKSKKRIRLCVLLLVLNVAFIWGNSLLPGEVSGAISHFVKNILAAVFPNMGPDEGGEGHHLVRKLAHFTEFACLGALVSCLVRMVYTGKWECVALPLLSGILVAAVDETIQFFVPDRGPSIIDVGIDALGVSLGIVLIILSIRIKQSFRRKI